MTNRRFVNRTTLFLIALYGVLALTTVAPVVAQFSGGDPPNIYGDVDVQPKSSSTVNVIYELLDDADSCTIWITCNGVMYYIDDSIPSTEGIHTIEVPVTQDPSYCAFQIQAVVNQGVIEPPAYLEFTFSAGVPTIATSNMNYYPFAQTPVYYTTQPNKCAMPERSTGGLTIIDPAIRNAALVSYDYMPPTAAGGLFSLGDQAITRQLPSCSLIRKFIPNDTFTQSSFGPAFFAEWDAKLYFTNSGSASEGVVARLLDTQLDFTITLSDGQDGPVDGLFIDYSHRYIKSLEMLPSINSTTPVSDIASATHARLTRYNGQKLIFEMCDLNGDPGEDKYARLIRIEERNGFGTDFEYASAASAGNDSIWILSKITDAYDEVMTFDYYPTQISARWCMQTVFLPGYDAATNPTAKIEYTYSENFLSTVTYPDGSVATYAFGENTSAQTATITWYEPAAVHPLDRNVTCHVTQSFMTLDNEMVNQPLGVLRLKECGSEHFVSVYHDPDDSSHALIRRGSRGLDSFHAHWKHQRYVEWLIDPNQSGFDVFDGVTEGNCPTHDFPDVQFHDPDNPDPDAPQISRSTPGLIHTGTCMQLELEYDDDSFPVKVTWTDSTFAETTYNQFKQVTRYRDRLGRVTHYNYDSQGTLLSIVVGLLEVGGADMSTPETATYTYQYNGGGLLSSELNPVNPGNIPDLYRTDYTYHGNGRLHKIIEAADDSGGTRPESAYLYSHDSLVSVTDPNGVETTLDYDAWKRLTQVNYADGSNRQILYAENLTTKTKDRNGTVTVTTYDACSRSIDVEVGAEIDSDLYGPGGGPNPDTYAREITHITYDSGTLLPIQIFRNGEKMEITYDHRDRITAVKSYTSAGQFLQAKDVYNQCNLKEYSEDPWGRRTYEYRRSVDNALLRVVRGMKPGDVLGGSAVSALVRDATANAACTILDYVKDAEEQVTSLIDPRGIETRLEYDSRGRGTKEITAFGTPVAATSEVDYELDDLISKVRTPRHFDTSDPQQGNLESLFFYNGRRIGNSMTAVHSSNVAASISMSYHLDGNLHQVTDARNNVWTAYWNSLTGRFQGLADPLGNGSLVNTDTVGQGSHGAMVEQLASNLGDNPVNNQTLSEFTIRRNAIGRAVAGTHWLTPRESIDPDDVENAGLDGIARSLGNTSQLLYDEDLTDGIGLDSASGASVQNLDGSGSFTVSLAGCLTKLAAPVASGGANLSFGAEADGSAMVVINAEQEIRASIRDAMGRTILSAVLEGPDGSAPGTLITWSCIRHDDLTPLAGFGDVRQKLSIDVYGKTVAYLSDGGGRTLAAIDQNGNTGTYQFDANSNLTSSRSPLGIGLDKVYDEQNRVVSSTNTWGNTTTYQYDHEGNLTSVTDPRSAVTSAVYDARSRIKSVTDRIGGVTKYVYDANDNVTSVEDAQGNVTSYVYNELNKVTLETFASHVPSSNPGATGYDRREYSYDAAGRIASFEDQSGRKMVRVRDLAGRVTNRQYRNAADTLLDENSYTHDAAGRLLTASSGRYVNTTTLAYDVAGRLQSETLSFGGKNYTTTRDYDTASRLKELVYPDGTQVQRTYTSRHLLHQVKRNGVVVDTLSYDQDRRRQSRSYANGVTTTWAYRSNGSQKDNRLASITTTHPSGATQTVGDFSFGYDGNGNRTSQSITGTLSGRAISSSSYDSDDRVTTASRQDGNQDQSWVLSLVGNWNSVTDEATTTVNTHNATHELTAVGPSSLAHDVKGNITTDENGSTYTWDPDNQLVSTSVSGGPVVGYQYDALGRRVSKTVGSSTTNFAMHGYQVLSEYTSTASETSSTETWIYSSYIDEPILKRGTGGDQYYHRNSQYSTVALTNTSGNVTERYSYDTYGSLTVHNASGSVISASAYNNPNTFTGRRYEKETDNYYFRARWYDSDFGRFLTRDPLGYVDGMSQYGGYFAPGGVDPWGTQELKIGKDPGPPSVTLADPSDAGLVSEMTPGDWDFVSPQPGVPVVPKPGKNSPPVPPGSPNTGGSAGETSRGGGGNEGGVVDPAYDKPWGFDPDDDFHWIPVANPSPAVREFKQGTNKRSPEEIVNSGESLSAGMLVQRKRFVPNKEAAKLWEKTGFFAAGAYLFAGAILGQSELVQRGVALAKTETGKVVGSIILGAVGGAIIGVVVYKSRGLIKRAWNWFRGKRVPKISQGKLEGVTDYQVFDPLTGKTITDIDEIVDGVLWELKSAVSAIDISKWVNRHISGKLEKYLRARKHLDGYSDAPIGFRFERPISDPDFKKAVMDRIEELRKKYPSVEIRVDGM